MTIATNGTRTRDDQIKAFFVHLPNGFTFELECTFAGGRKGCREEAQGQTPGPSHSRAFKILLCWKQTKMVLSLCLNMLSGTSWCVCEDAQQMHLSLPALLADAVRWFLHFKRALRERQKEV